MANGQRFEVGLFSDLEVAAAARAEAALQYHGAFAKLN
jgi:hypothetical protein